MPSYFSSTVLFYSLCVCSFFFFNATATTEIYTLSLHDALPISGEVLVRGQGDLVLRLPRDRPPAGGDRLVRSEEHTSELQSRGHLVCRLLLEKKKKKTPTQTISASIRVAYL